MKKIIITIVWLFVQDLAYGQASPTSFVMDTALVKVGYERIKLLDTLNVNNIKIDYLTLQAGYKSTVFYSEFRRREDGLLMNDNDYFRKALTDHSIIENLSKCEADIIVKRYDKRQTWSLQRFDFTNWIIYDELEKPIWNITGETDSILGFTCIKAETSFRGRKWVAFFTPEIPIQEGPWKLYGLPGLILKAYDSKKHYVYEAKDINTVSPGLVEYVNYDDRLAINDRKKALRMRNEYKKKDFRALVAGLTGAKLNKPKDDSETKRENHDFEETDYPHE